MITDSYKQLFLFFILLTLVSCRQQSESVAGVTTVRIEDFQDKVLKTGDFLSGVRTLSLHDDSLGYIGQIKDVCAVDSFLYVLDGITASLTQFQIGAGKQMRSVCKRGNGPYEYIQPLALTADGPYLYVLDLPGMSVIAFDATLQGYGWGRKSAQQLFARQGGYVFFFGEQGVCEGRSGKDFYKSSVFPHDLSMGQYREETSGISGV